MVERGIKFSCRFTYAEISQRWQALLYDPVVSRVAMAAVRNLHPDLVAAVYAKALYSIAEEELLASVKSVRIHLIIFAGRFKLYWDKVPRRYQLLLLVVMIENLLSLVGNYEHRIVHFVSNILMTFSD